MSVSLRATLAWVGPFVVFLAMLGIVPSIIEPSRASLAMWIVLVGASIFLFSRKILRFEVRRPWASIGVGVVLFFVWIAPDVLMPGWRSHVLFQNFLTGKLATSMAASSLADPVALGMRTLRAVLLVPIVEELFWRGWLMRWLERHDFERVPLGQCSRNTFWIVAVMFALEHGPFWDVGLLAGAGYNWWIVRTKTLGDVILAHATTNACLCGYVIATGRWEYWL